MLPERAFSPHGSSMSHPFISRRRSNYGETKVIVPEGNKSVRVLQARRDSLCPACSQPITAGKDWIIRDNARQAFVHRSCINREAEERSQLASGG